MRRAGEEKREGEENGGGWRSWRCPVKTRTPTLGVREKKNFQRNIGTVENREAGGRRGVDGFDCGGVDGGSGGVDGGATSDASVLPAVALASAAAVGAESDETASAASTAAAAGVCGGDGPILASRSRVTAAQLKQEARSGRLRGRAFFPN